MARPATRVHTGCVPVTRMSMCWVLGDGVLANFEARAALPVSLTAVGESQALPHVTARLHGVAPRSILQIPLNRCGEAGIEIVNWLPSKFSTNLARVDRVASIVAGAVFDEAFQFPITTNSLGDQSIVLGGGPQCLERITNLIHDLKV